MLFSTCLPIHLAPGRNRLENPTWDGQGFGSRKRSGDRANTKESRPAHSSGMGKKSGEMDGISFSVRQLQ